MFLSRHFDYTKIRAQMANVLTLLNLSFSIMALMLILKGFFHWSIVFLLIAALFDRFDGMVARHLNVESAFGKELDSLSDIVSFGIAPSLLLYQSVFHDLSFLGAAVTIFYILAGAVRLARYNITDFDGVFCGLPITAAGVILVISFFFVSFIPSFVYAILMFILGLLMVSTIRITKV